MKHEEYLEHDFIEVYEDSNGEKMVNPLFYVYTNGDDFGYGEYRIVEYRVSDIPLKEYLSPEFEICNCEYFDTRIGDATESEADEYIEEILNDERYMQNIKYSMDMPCGIY